MSHQARSFTGSFAGICGSTAISTVCESRFHDGDSIRDGAMIVRDVEWRGWQFQCMVDFRPGDPGADDLDLGTPGTRVANAIAVCDSLSFHVPTAADRLRVRIPGTSGSGRARPDPE